MISPISLGGFKILSDVTWLQLALPGSGGGGPAGVLRRLAEREINLPYLTCTRIGADWKVDFLVEAPQADKAREAVEQSCGRNISRISRAAVLSIFPHRSKPEITAALVEIFGGCGLPPLTITQSPSAVSAVIEAEQVDRVSEALFGPFVFSAYRTPADWKLSRKGKEELYREVVASYQEKNPKVYALEWQRNLGLLPVSLPPAALGDLGRALREFALRDKASASLAVGSVQGQAGFHLSFAVSGASREDFSSLVDARVPQATLGEIPAVALFSMNGPHFGDRYGIVSELLAAFDRDGIPILALGCSIASICGVVAADQIAPATRCIQNCFEVPSIIDRTEKTASAG